MMLVESSIEHPSGRVGTPRNSSVSITSQTITTTVLLPSALLCIDLLLTLLSHPHRRLGIFLYG